ncbi:hypothetical protein HEK616_36200 [Streptomyces nigrescens]|uniref:Uncharacterized protein n=1 Tax=Streptomyces nigrescens TaxID=1920 RepID=A0ABM7ZVF2_STRNI|nr:hypothetical protein HEK616_36200 [Streptomyces nigrescens]
MAYKEKQTSTSAGSFVLRRHTEVQEFVCDRDLLPRTAKIVVHWTTPEGIERKICNSCYGFLVSHP